MLIRNSICCTSNLRIYYIRFMTLNELSHVRATNGLLSIHIHNSGPEVIKLISCSTELSMKFFLLINVKMPTTVGILTLMNRKNSIFGLSEPE